MADDKHAHGHTTEEHKHDATVLSGKTILWVTSLNALITAAEIVDILMQSSAVLDYDAIAKDVEAFPEVNNIHHVHSWMGNEKTVYFEAHVDMVDMTLCEADIILGRIESLLKDKYDISHTTLQAETDKCHDKSLIRT